MIAAVTGGTGFIGVPLVKRLASLGHKVRVLARPTSDVSMHEGVEIVRGDLFDSASLYRLCAGADALFHVAGDLSFWRGHNAHQDRINIEGTRGVMKAAAAAHVRRVVHTSSVAALGMPEKAGLPGNEAQPFLGGKYSNYFRSKRAAEEAAFAAGREHRIEVVAVNPGVVFGGAVGRRKSGSQRTIRMIDRGVTRLFGKPLRFYLRGGYCACNVSDVVEGHVLAFERGRAGERYILGGHNVTLRALFTRIAEKLGVSPPRLMPPWLSLAVAAFAEARGAVTGQQPRITWDYARVGNMLSWWDSSKAIRELGYPVTDLETTIDMGIASYRAAEEKRPGAHY